MIQAMPVNDLVSQAHMMMKDGGGEMRVVLTPEGLGEVAMKISVDGNKVNVQMITQSDDAKKLLGERLPYSQGRFERPSFESWNP